MVEVAECSKRRRPIHFVYAPQYRESGTTVMRGEQLSAIAARAFSEPGIVHFSPIGTTFKNSVLFLTSNALSLLGPHELESLHNSHNRLVFDPVDKNLQLEKIPFADAVVAASRSAFHTYRTLLPKTPVFVVDHHADPRLRKLNWHARPIGFHAAYFGELLNTIATPAIKRVVDFHQVHTSKQDSGWFTSMASYNFHYAIRQRRERDGHKPFTKGFVAALCGVNMLIQESEGEAVYWLGKDYPYILHGEVTEREILNMLDVARDSYGSKDWVRGLAIMRDIAERTSDAAIGRQLAVLFGEVGR